jgi:hypothetical protein
MDVLLRHLLGGGIGAVMIVALAFLELSARVIEMGPEGERGKINGDRSEAEPLGKLHQRGGP